MVSVRNNNNILRFTLGVVVVPFFLARALFFLWRALHFSLFLSIVSSFHFHLIVMDVKCIEQGREAPFRRILKVLLRYYRFLPGGNLLFGRQQNSLLGLPSGHFPIHHHHHHVAAPRVDFLRPLVLKSQNPTPLTQHRWWN